MRILTLLLKWENEPDPMPPSTLRLEVYVTSTVITQISNMFVLIKYYYSFIVEAIHDQELSKHFTLEKKTCLQNLNTGLVASVDMSTPGVLSFKPRLLPDKLCLWLIGPNKIRRLCLEVSNYGAAHPTLTNLNYENSILRHNVWPTPQTRPQELDLLLVKIFCMRISIYVWPYIIYYISFLEWQHQISHYLC